MTGMQSVLLLMLAVSLAGPACARAPVSYPPVIDSRNNPPLVRTHSFRWLEDASGRLGLEDVRTRPELWQIHTDVTPTFGYSSAAYWLRFRLENRGPAPATFILLINNEYIDRFEIDAFRETGNSTTHAFRKVGGQELPFGSREILQRKYAFPVVLEGHSQYEVFMSVRSDNSINVPLFLMTPEDYDERLGLENLRMGIYGGLFVLLLILNVAFYLFLREPLFLVYVAYLFFSFIFQFSLQGYAYKYLWPAHPIWGGIFNAIAFCPSVVMAGLFAREFLGTRSRHRRLDQLILVQIFIWALLPFGLLFMNTGDLEGFMAKVLGPVIILTLYAAGWRVYLAGYRPARFYVFAWSAYLPFCIFYILQVNGIVANGVFGLDMLENLAVGISLEMLIFPFAIGDRLRLALDRTDSPRRDRSGSGTPARTVRMDHAEVERRLREALEVRKMYRNDLKLLELAAEIDLSEKDLSSYLNNVVGKSFYTLISEYRIAEAQRMLIEEPQEKVIAVAHAIGFQSLSAFHRAFQKIVGTSPRAYRKRNGAGPA